jgi:hypothetical protein
MSDVNEKPRSAASLGPAFYELLRFSDEKDPAKRHEAIKAWWDQHVLLIQSQVSLTAMELEMSYDRYGVLSHVLRSNVLSLGKYVAEKHGVIQQVPPDSLPDRYDPRWSNVVDLMSHPPLTWLARLTVLLP